MKKNEYKYAFKLLLICLLFSAVIVLLAVLFQHACINDDYLIHVSAVSSVKVVIDAGHGGRDGGAVSADGHFEKDINLSLSSTLHDFLTLSGVDSLMTRKDDSLVCDESDPSLKGKFKMTDLKNRLSIAEDNQNAIFVSIHMNKFPIEKYRGLQVYYSKNNEKSAVLAKNVQETVREKLQPSNNRECKAAGSNIYILDRISIPAVLIECGFLSNREEAEMLASEEYRTKLALVIAESIFESIANN